MAVHPLWRPFTPSSKVDRRSRRVAHRQTEPGPLQAHQLSWATDYTVVQCLVDTAIPEVILTAKHVGSTSVPGMIAMPVIDLDLTVQFSTNRSTCLNSRQSASD